MCVCSFDIMPRRVRACYVIAVLDYLLVAINMWCFNNCGCLVSDKAVFKVGEELEKRIYSIGFYPGFYVLKTRI